MPVYWLFGGNLLSLLQNKNNAIMKNKILRLLSISQNRLIFTGVSVCSLFTGSVLFATEYHVSVKGSDRNAGSIEKPFKTIQAAANKSQPGDTVTVHAGTYREWINPPRGGESNEKRITYRAAPGEKVEIKGSEQVTGWKKVTENVWKIVLPNSFFGNFNPFAETVHGDWFSPCGRLHHLGEVYLNGHSFYERDSLHEVITPKPVVTLRDPDGATDVWYCEVTPETTAIWVNFGNINPNRETVEVNTRKTCFYPTLEGINYITVSGFCFSQAATQWAAPTAEQIGMIATHWNKGWIIENNTVSNAKCSGITLGKERKTGHNVWSENPQKDGALHYIEVIFRVLRNGWSKENIGSHIVRNNNIYYCEQTGICGSMGAAFSKITNNYIHDIWVKRQFDGAEIAGIKFHAAIDALLANNRIQNCGRGIWLDWMAQGTRVSSNLLYSNTIQDLFLEVNHGPFIVDNNIMLSRQSVLEISEGGAFVHNLFGGSIQTRPELKRYTPYHLPHSTEIAGFSVVLNGDDRFYNNIFAGSSDSNQGEGNPGYGLPAYNKALQPGRAGGNVYCNGAQPYQNESGSVSDIVFNPEIRLEEKGAEVWLHFRFDGFKEKMPSTRLITTDVLEKTKLVGANYENPDGSALFINKDYFGNKRSTDMPVAGPFEHIELADNNFLVWENIITDK